MIRRNHAVQVTHFPAVSLYLLDVALGVRGALDRGRGQVTGAGRGGATGS